MVIISSQKKVIIKELLVFVDNVYGLFQALSLDINRDETKTCQELR